MTSSKLVNVLGAAIVVILLLMPISAPMTVWLASHFNHFDLWRIWKDLLLVPLGLGAIWLAATNTKLSRKLLAEPLIGLIGLFALLEIGLGIWARLSQHVNSSALLYGWISDLQYLAIFVIALIVGGLKPIKRHWLQILLIPAVIVVTFGLLQRFVLPVDFLRHLGYEPRTYPAVETVNQNINFVRLQSSLRGANPLGAYLVLVVTSSLAVYISHKKPRRAIIAFIAAGLLVLFFTYSRSAWLGLAVSIATFCWLSIKSVKLRNYTFIAGLILAGIIGTGVLLLRHNATVENTFFHISQNSQSPRSSNQDRTSALENGLRDLWRQPLGSGPGSAGPASVRNNRPPRIAENYYIQIGQELGLAGLVVFLLINIYVTIYLWRQRKDQLSLVLLASFVGLSIINLLSHAWADDTLALIWWGLAGLALAPAAILNKERKPQNV